VKQKKEENWRKKFRAISNWRRLKKLRENWRKKFEEGFAWPKMVFRVL
jgi:hypothetical protein